MCYCVKKFKEVELFPNDDDMTNFFLFFEIQKDLNTEFNNFALKNEEITQLGLEDSYNAYLDKNMFKLEQMDEHLKTNRWVLGDELSILDFTLAETLKKVLIFEQDVDYDVVL